MGKKDGQQVKTSELPRLQLGPWSAQMTKAQKVAKRICAGIVLGLYPPGTQLPMRKNILSETDASWVTIQRAFDLLKASGTVRSVKGRGTYVTDCPPCLYRYGVVFPDRPPEKPSFYVEAMEEAARELNEHGPVEFRLYREAYHYLSGDPAGDAWDELLRDVERMNLGGVIFVRNPGPVANRDIYTAPQAPRIAVATQPPGFPSVGGLQLGGTKDMVEKALDYFQDQGRRRIGALVPGVRFASEARANLFEAASQRGMQIRRYWVQSPHVEEPEWTSNSAELLMRLPNDDRPNGLMILDDHLVGPASEGLDAANVRVPEDVDVVVHCNFPHLPCPERPFRRLGYDHREALVEGVLWLRARICGENDGGEVIVPARFERELRGINELANSLTPACEGE